MQYLYSRSLLTTPNTESLGSLTWGIEYGSLTKQIGEGNEALTLLSEVVEAQHCLLEVVDRDETSRASYACTAVEHYFVALFDGCDSALLVDAARVVLSDVFDD